MCESGEREARPPALLAAQGEQLFARSPHAANPHVLSEYVPVARLARLVLPSLATL